MVAVVMVVAVVGVVLVLVFVAVVVMVVVVVLMVVVVLVVVVVVVGVVGWWWQWWWWQWWWWQWWWWQWWWWGGGLLHAQSPTLCPVAQSWTGTRLALLFRRPTGVRCERVSLEERGCCLGQLLIDWGWGCASCRRRVYH